MGKTGCGKSTSVNLLQRLYDVDTGTVTIDNEPIAHYDVHHLRRNIGIVSQDNVLFSTSIKENIMYGMGQGHLPEPTDEEIWAICDKANATEFINSFPNKHYTNVGERGVKLSGGQKQRIAIARAMIRKPTILLLDEATSALDAASEKVVQKALDDMLTEHDGVAVVVAHRLTTIKNCNTIVVMVRPCAPCCPAAPCSDRRGDAVDRRRARRWRRGRTRSCSRSRSRRTRTGSRSRATTTCSGTRRWARSPSAPRST